MLLACGSESQKEVVVEEVINPKSKTIDSLLNVLHTKGRFNASILVAEDDEVTYKNGFGYTNFDTKDSLTSEKDAFG